MNTRKAGPTNQPTKAVIIKKSSMPLFSNYPSIETTDSIQSAADRGKKPTYILCPKTEKNSGGGKKEKEKEKFPIHLPKPQRPAIHVPTYLPSYTSTQRDWYHFREKTVRGSNEWGGKMSRERNESQTWSPFIHYFIFERWFSFPWAPFLSTSPRSVMKIFISFPFSRFSPASAISQRNGKGVKGTGVFLTRSWQKKFPSFLRFLIETFLPRSAVDKLVRTYVCECLGS